MASREISAAVSKNYTRRINVLCLTRPLKIGYMFGMANLVFGSDHWKFQFDDPSGFSLNLLASSTGFGMLIGFVAYNSFKGKNNDLLILFLSNIILVIGILLQILSKSYFVFFIARWLCGVGISLSNAAQPGISSKCTIPYHETIENSFMFLGVVLGNVIAFPSGTPHLWRILSAYQLILPLFQIAVLSIPELPHLEADNSDDKQKQFSYMPSKTIFWYSLAAIVTPMISTHIGGGILLTVICQLLEIKHGMDFKHQQISINSILVIHHCISGIVKSLHKSDISNHRLTALSLMTTSASILTTTTSYNVKLLDSTFLTLLAYIWIILIGLPTFYLTTTIPELALLIGFSSNLTALYNGLINPMIMNQAQWSRYSLGCLVGLINWAVIAVVSLVYRTPSVHCIESILELQSTVSK